MSKRKLSPIPRRGTTGTAKRVLAFSEDQVVRITGVSKRQLRYWDGKEFFVPSLAYRDRSRKYSRLYSFRDLVSLKILNELRNESRVPLSELERVKEKLRHFGDDVWLKTKLYVHKKNIAIVNPETQELEEVVTGQGVFKIAIEVVAGDMEEAINSFRRRDDSVIGQFEKKRGVVHNQLVIKGTRIPVRSVKAFHEAGHSIEQIKKEYPTLTDEDIRAAIAYRAAA